MLEFEEQQKLRSLHTQSKVPRLLVHSFNERLGKDSLLCKLPTSRPQSVAPESVKGSKYRKSAVNLGMPVKQAQAKKSEQVVRVSSIPAHSEGFTPVYLLAKEDAESSMRLLSAMKSKNKTTYLTASTQHF